MQKVIAKPAKSRIKYELETITPTIAKAWLDKNTNNRSLRKITVEKYAHDIATGGWQLTFDPIRFDTNGTLLDGQHRLAACVLADKPFQALVVYGMPEESISAIDIGRARSTADVLRLNGQANPNTVAAMAKWIWTIKHDYNDPSKASVLSVAQTMEIVDRHPKMPLFASNYTAYSKRCPSPALLVTVGYIAHNILREEDRALAFLQVFRSGVPDYRDCPAHKLREFVIASHGQRSALSTREYKDSTLHVWNLFRQKKSMKALRWPKNVQIDGLDLDLL